jgi:hypothetical protein
VRGLQFLRDSLDLEKAIPLNISAYVYPKRIAGNVSTNSYLKWTSISPVLRPKFGSRITIFF